MEAMIFAAGLGTRLQSETSDKPKALVEVGGKPLIRHAIEKVVNAGATKIVVNVHHFAELVSDYLKSEDFGVEVLISDETGRLLETGGGLKKAAPLFSGNDPILIYNVDILSDLDLKQVLKTHLENESLATLVVRERETSRYLKFDDEMQLSGWINKKSGETKVSRPEAFSASRELAFSGIHIVQPEIFNYIPQEERFSIIDWYLELAKTKTIKGYFDQSKLWMDVGKPAELEAARRLFSV
ncbi:nucleotidyltransferase family protein [Maribellus sediminis]|uniref:nucleotidyltransferase family protein n=1 Tax=Maribellus sediminis TaxID=2696285 RepID=UPI00143045F8|nr:nucleotidyltransferase family protein [Maribellus sediminis]